MKASRYSTSRQKVCRGCSASKAKCDRIESGCSRCAQRGLVCTYPGLPSPRDPTPLTDERATRRAQAGTAHIGKGNVAPPYTFTAENGSLLYETFSHTDNDVASPSEPTLVSQRPQRPHDETNGSIVGSRKVHGTDDAEFTNLRLTCPINAEDIANRWLGAYIPLPDQKVKQYPTTISTFLHRMIKSYITVAVRGRGHPPFVHAAQLATSRVKPPLSTCLSLIRICENQLPGSEETAAAVLQREMQDIFEQRGTFDAFTLLYAFQAYLIYTMVLFFRLGQITNPFLRQAVMNLQELACASAKKGLVCEAEQQCLRPKWESWIVAEANRRTLYTMYLFDGVLSAHDGLPTFIGTELAGLPAPASHTLWRAQTRTDWNAAYNLFLADWSEGGLRIDELWPVPEHFDENEVVERRNRVDRWLEGVDEYGTMLYAVTCCTHAQP